MFFQTPIVVPYPIIDGGGAQTEPVPMSFKICCLVLCLMVAALGGVFLSAAYIGAGYARGERLLLSIVGLGAIVTAVCIACSIFGLF